MKKSNDTIGNRTRDLPAGSAVPQPTAPPRALERMHYAILSSVAYPALQYFSTLPHERHNLTLRLLMSFIYMEHIFLMFLDHTQRRTTVGRTPLDE